MARRLRVRDNPTASFFGGVVGLIFVGIGLFAVIPTFGPFGYLWTLIAIVITGGNFYNALSKRGIATEIIEVSDDERSVAAPAESAASRLTQLKELRDQGLITAAEYEERRAAVVRGL